ncbi:MAG: hypothetical protein OEV00_00405 [Acidobacteriota bacterium]|nr:hypothetical protein [Acidobacteriota bacterium]MDH3783765.1 hypothetical protein [Acidobacteriota bacterium]
MDRTHRIIFGVVVIVLALSSSGWCDGEQADASLARAVVSTHTVQDSRLDEVSGIVASRRHPGYFWTHNDSGDRPLLYVIDVRGANVATFELDGATNVDWEDIALGPGPKPKRDYLYVADIGDNAAHRKNVVIYRIEEPDLEFVKPGDHLVEQEVQKLSYRYADGARDAETLFVDPVDRNMVIITKRSPEVHVYQTSIDGDWSADRELERLRRIPFTNIVGGDLSSDGTELLLKTYTHVLYWRRESGNSIEQLFDVTPQELPYRLEPQGEAIAWSHDATRYITLSEERGGIAAVLYRYPMDDGLRGN